MLVFSKNVFITVSTKNQDYFAKKKRRNASFFALTYFIDLHELEVGVLGQQIVGG